MPTRAAAQTCYSSKMDADPRCASGSSRDGFAWRWVALLASVWACLAGGWGCSWGAPGPSSEVVPDPPSAVVVEPRTMNPVALSAPASAPEPEREPTPGPRAHLALGGSFGCWSDERGEVRCFGGNLFGQRGVAPERRGDPSPTTIGHANRFAVGTWHACLLGVDGMARCLGHGGRGQLGDGASEDRVEPTPVALAEVVDVCAGEAHSCARRADRTVHCWGSNDRGQVGADAPARRLTPAQVALSDVVEIACGRAHTCARDAAGSIYCWGENVDGQLGDGTRAEPSGSRSAPARVPFEGAFERVFAGPGATCGLREGRAWCWGRNDSSQLSAAGGAPEDALLAPTALEVNDIVEVALGARHTCVLDRAGKVRCVGGNRLGQLGDGTRRPRRAFVEVVLSGPATAVAAGVDHTCVLVGGGPQCWGTNRDGQLGHAPRGRERWSTTPVALRFDEAASQRAPAHAPR